MKVAIVHLSDIHFKSTASVGFRRLSKLANIIRYSCSHEERIVFVIAGDIAFSGSVAEYDVAEQFFKTLLIGLGIKFVSPDSIIFVPGNHDCDFHNPGDLRPRLIEDIASTVDTLDAEGEIVKTLLRVQDNFFSFLVRMGDQTETGPRKLFRRDNISDGHKTLEIRSFNSAWLSKRREEPGALGFPSSTIEEARSVPTDADVVITMVHHPSNWLSPSAHQNFRRAVQETSDFLITGHEHVQGGQTINSFTGTSVVHFECGAYQPEGSGDSAFGILHIDVAQREWRHEDFMWSQGSYIKANLTNPRPLASKRDRSTTLQITESFLKKLRDPGTGFLHPRQQQLTLSDIYVYPNLKIRQASRRLRATSELPHNIPSNQVVSHLLQAKRLVIAGPTDCGKTALAKMLYTELNNEHGRNCLLLNGKDLKGLDPVGALTQATNSRIDEQYGTNHRGRFASLDLTQRVLMIDNWDCVPFNQTGRAELLKNAAVQYGTIWLFADDIALIEELSGRRETSSLKDFEISDIKEFGFHLRGELIWKWQTLGNVYVEDDKATARNIADSTRVIDTVLGRNLLPSYPVNVLTLLQTYDAGSNTQNSELGSYGQIYEALITARLSKASVRAVEIGMKVTFLARVAWLLFSSRKRHINHQEWLELGNRYFLEYKVPVDSSALLTSLLDAGILLSDEQGYRFTYAYAYCYFVAKYFQENLADRSSTTGRAALFSELTGLSERVYKQDNASIVIFYVFLTKDRDLIYQVVANARQIFSEVMEFDFVSQVGFMDTISAPLSPMALPSEGIMTNHHAHNKMRDETGEEIEPRADTSTEDVVYRRGMPFAHEFIIGIRYLTVMGQILRNFPGSLKADVKLELAFESYSLGLRLLGSVFSMAERDATDLVAEISEVLRTKMAFAGPDRAVQDKAKIVIWEMLRELSFGLLKRMSHAIGLKELEATYNEVAGLRDGSLATQLVQLSITLDHFDRFPVDQVHDLAKSLRTNIFSYQTLRDLVLNHLYLFPADYKTRTSMANLLKFRDNVPYIRATSGKLLQGR